MIKDSKAEALEAKGLYRRAAARWAEVMAQVDSDKERELAAKRRSECIRKAERPPARLESYGDACQAIRRAHDGMGLHSPHGTRFRVFPKG
ncbi:PerC family transcriptional regulator [Escherichia coli]|uniref:PerC family transcriptional regulator n=1 Tax=Escherichia coli TaxID=562 RepID=UPI000BA7DD4A|nr:PerC family transcriptional regulator [Escherichia coli]EET2792512.1 PerC family transcriptional regulator [Escherichia coli]EEV0909168.1 PerC family transcriptional regulator [Escherichia coli]EEZ6040967.1 PerC family transcriptional regulator [Escherichia coli]EFA0722828.1 PerC family transcriptional regulator [Escherichia coli]EFC2178958.1 PerC family transcriptional regulator [Escherichia coli]